MDGFINGVFLMGAEFVEGLFNLITTHPELTVLLLLVMFPRFVFRFIPLVFVNQLTLRELVRIIRISLYRARGYFAQLNQRVSSLEIIAETMEENTINSTELLTEVIEQHTLVQEEAVVRNEEIHVNHIATNRNPITRIFATGIGNLTGFFNTRIGRVTGIVGGMFALANIGTIATALITGTQGINNVFDAIGNRVQNFFPPRALIPAEAPTGPLTIPARPEEILPEGGAVIDPRNLSNASLFRELFRRARDIYREIFGGR